MNYLHVIFDRDCQLLIKPIKSNFKQTFYKVKFQRDPYLKYLQISHPKLEK